MARYYAAVTPGRRLPVVGVTDCHGVNQGDLYTIVFAQSGELADLQAAIADEYSVAVERIPGATRSRPHGPFRLVKYATFLLSEVFPAHDALCKTEGDLMTAHVAGDATAVEKLTPLRGQVARLYDRLWAPTPAP